MTTNKGKTGSRFYDEKNVKNKNKNRKEGKGKARKTEEIKNMIIL